VLPSLRCLSPPGTLHFRRAVPWTRNGCSSHAVDCWEDGVLQLFRTSYCTKQPGQFPLTTRTLQAMASLWHH
jgi:hypothetical protein